MLMIGLDLGKGVALRGVGDNKGPGEGAASSSFAQTVEKLSARYYYNFMIFRSFRLCRKPFSVV